MAIQKTHQYKIYTPAGVYLGMLQNVTSPFGYNQNIATTFAQMTVTVAQSADVASLPNEAITDEMRNVITDESGNPILIERQPDIVGGSNALIANNNLIKVYEYSSYYPNGLKVFDGYISKWKTTFGATDDISITCISNGSDMNNILVQSGDLAVITQNTDTGSTFTSTNTGNGQWILQTFSVATAYQISAVTLEITTTVAATLQIGIKQQLGPSPNPTSDPYVASGSALVAIVTKITQKISVNPTLLNPAYTYYIQIYWQDASNLTLFASNVQPYGSGNVYTLTSTGTTFTTPVLQVGYSLYFIVWQYGGNVTGAYTNTDPASILTNQRSGHSVSRR